MPARYIDGTDAACILGVPAEMMATFVRRGNLRVTKKGLFLTSDVERFRQMRLQAQTKHETWRERLAPIIRQVIQDTQGQDDAVIRRALRDAYPCAERRGYAYQCWLDEIKRQRGLKPKSGTRQLSEQEKAALGAQESLF